MWLKEETPSDLVTVVTAETQERPFGLDGIGSAAMIDLIGETPWGDNVDVGEDLGYFSEFRNEINAQIVEYACFVIQ